MVDTADDMRKIPSSINNLGKVNPDVHASDIPWDHEGSGFMSSMNQVPGMNALSHPHDTLATDFGLDPVSNVATIAPTGALTYSAMGTARDQELLNQSVKDAEDKKSD